MDVMPSWLKAPIRAVRTIVDDYAKWYAFQRELENAGEDGRRILQELRLCHGDVRRLISSRPDDASLLYRMMDTLGVDPDDIEAGILRDLERVCAGCAHKASCRDDLATGKAAERWTEYCANTVNLEAIRRDQRHAL